MMYRVRPDGYDPDCVFEIFSTKTSEQFLLIPRQDFSNMPRMQKGLHSIGCRQTWLASHHETIIMNMHRQLDRYLGA